MNTKGILTCYSCSYYSSMNLPSLRLKILSNNNHTSNNMSYKSTITCKLHKT